MIGGNAIYHDGQSSTIPIPHFDLSPDAFVLPTATHSQLASLDLDEDGYDDVEAWSPDTTTVYYGSPHGLTSGVELFGFPTADGDDGRFLTVTGPGNATLQYSHATVWIGVDDTQRPESFRLEVFDPDLGGLYDFETPDITCYSLTPDPDQPGSVPYSPLTTSDSSQLADGDGRWKTLYAGDITNAPKAYSGVRFLRLDVDLGSGACGSLLGPPSTGAQNAFKVRASAPIWVEMSEWSFNARDAAGPFAVQSFGARPTQDTTFDGTFDFLMYVSDTVDSVELREADADYADDPDSPGEALGRTPDIRYSFTHDASGEGLMDVIPSGNYDPVVQPYKSRTVSTAGKTGWWWWSWHNVLTENNIHVYPVLNESQNRSASAGGAACSAMAVFGTPHPPHGRPKISSARTLEQWIAVGPRSAQPTASADAVRAIDALEAVSSGFAQTGADVPPAVEALHHVWRTGIGRAKSPGRPGRDQLRDVLVDAASGTPGDARKGQVRHGCSERLQMMAEFAAQALVAHLNLGLARQIQEPLETAVLYGRTETVRDVVAQADAALTRMLWNPRQIDWVEVQQLARLLRGINEGWITYLPQTCGVRERRSAGSTPTLRSSSSAPQ